MVKNWWLFLRKLISYLGYNHLLRIPNGIGIVLKHILHVHYIRWGILRSFLARVRPQNPPFGHRQSRCREKRTSDLRAWTETVSFPRSSVNTVQDTSDTVDHSKSLKRKQKTRAGYTLLSFSGEFRRKNITVVVREYIGGGKRMYLNTSGISFAVWGCGSLDNLHEIIVGMSGKCIAACVKAQRGSSRQPKVKVHISGLHLVKLNVPIPVSRDTLAQSIFGTQFNLAAMMPTISKSVFHGSQKQWTYLKVVPSGGKFRGLSITLLFS